MDERETLIAKVTNKATKEAKKQKLNEAQAKLYIESEVQKALEEFDVKQTENKETVEPTNPTEEDKKTSDVKTEKQKGNKTQTESKEKRYIVHTPVPNYCGVIANVHFAYGKAEVKPGWVLNWFKEHGYKIEEVSD